MFKVIDNPTFTIEVAVLVPVDGGHDRQSVRATYNVIPTDEMAGFDLTTAKGTRKFLERAVKRLDDVVDEKGEPLPWSDRLRDRLLTLPYVVTALARGYFENVNKAALGN